MIITAISVSVTQLFVMAFIQKPESRVTIEKPAALWRQTRKTAPRSTPRFKEL